MKFKTAVQLYSLRNTYEKNPLECLRAVKKMGYDGIELCGRSGVDSKWLRGVCDTLELEIPSIHISLGAMCEFPHEFAEEARTLGLKYAAIPYMSEGRDFPGMWHFENIKRDIEKVAKELSKYGISILYHNHTAEFDLKTNGEYLYDSLMNAFTADVLKCEIDVSWAHAKGVDPAWAILKYKGRIPAVHLKDYKYVGRGKNKNFTPCTFGDGVVNALDAVKAAKEAGTEWLIYEQDSPYPSTKTELYCAEKSLKNIKKLISETEK